MLQTLSRGARRLNGVEFRQALEGFFVEMELDRDLDVGMDEPDHDLRRTVESAVDPLEIAAALEAIGVASQTITEEFGHDDVFDLAEHIYRVVPLRAAPAPARDVPRGGGLVELGRGAIFAVPGLAFTNVLGAGGLHLPWWCLPLALSIGWSAGQVVASLGYLLRNRQDVEGGATVSAALLVAAPIGTFALFVVAVAVGGVVHVSVPLVGALFVAYMVASGILLLHGDEWVLAISLVPTLTAAVVAVGASGWHAAGAVAITAQVVAVVIVVVGAARRARWAHPRRPRLLRADLGSALSHGLHGACCGAGVSVVLTLATRGQPVGGVGIVAWPLLASLGVMEWQHRTLARTVHRLQHSVCSVRRFSTMSGWALVRSMALYGLTVCAISGAVAVVFAVRERPIPVRPLVAQSLVGLALFVDLVAVSHAGIRRVLRCWLVGLTATAVSLWVLVEARPPMSMVDAWHCALVVAGIVAILLVIVAWQAVRSPIS